MATVDPSNSGAFQRVTAQNARDDDFLPVEVDGKFGRVRGKILRRIRNGVRSENYYVKFELGGKQVFQGLGTSRSSGALEIAKRKMRAALEGRWDALDASRLKHSAPTALMGDLFELYRTRIREFNPTIEPATVGNVISAMRSVLRTAGEDVEQLRASVLTEQLVEQFFAARVAQAGADRVERDRRIRGANSTLRNARTMFGKVAIKCYRGKQLPDLKGFLEAETHASPKLRNPDLPDDVVWEIAQAGECLQESSPALYLVHLLFRHLGLRNDEIENARMEWIERRASHVVLPNGERREIAGVLSIFKRPYWEPKQSEGLVPISPDVLGVIDRLTAGRGPLEHIIPARTATDRYNLAYYDHGNLVRPWLEHYPKKSYELRRWGATKIELRQGREFRDLFLRHADNSTGGRHYSTRQALPAPITYRDCGLPPSCWITCPS